jgi:hypothetical protein
MTLMRATVHMVTPRDAAFLRPLMQPAIERNHNGAFGRRMGDVRVDAARVLRLLRDGPRTAREVAREIGGDEEAVANAVRAYDHYDLPDAPRPDPDTPAPVRFLGEYDNVLLGHADRTRIIPPDFPWGDMLAHGRFVNNVLIDGMLRATWWLEDGVLAIRPFGTIPYDEVEAEARAMAAFAGADDVRFEPALP